MFRTVMRSSCNLRKKVLSDLNTSFKQGQEHSCYFLSKLRLSNPVYEGLGNASFPLVVQHEQIERVLNTWKESSGAVLAKETKPFVMTSAPTGSGKTHFLKSVCQIFSNKEAFFQHVPDDDISATELVGYLSSDDVLSNLMSTSHPCFITFNQRTSISADEIEMFAGRPILSVIARIIFAETENESWASFLKLNGKNISEIKSLMDVMDHFRVRRGVTNFMLAVDELVKVEEAYRCTMLQVKTGRGQKAAKSARGQKVVRVMKRQKKQPPKNWPAVSSVLSVLSEALCTDPRFFTVISSLVTHPLEEFLAGSQHTQIFVQLSPLHKSLRSLTHHVLARRGDGPELFAHVFVMLAYTGGHPSLLAKILPFVMNLDTLEGHMTLCNAISQCSEIGDYKSSKAFVASILTGSEVSEMVASEAAGCAGVLSRPSDARSIEILIASPLLVCELMDRLDCPNDIREFLKLPIMLSSKKFELFIASWLVFRLNSGSTLPALLSSYKSRGNNALVKQLGLRDDVGRPGGFVNEGVLLSSLPEENVQWTYNFAAANRENFGFAFDKTRPLVVIPANQRIGGFDIIVGSSSEKRVLFIQCKAHEFSTSIENGKGSTLEANDVRLCLQNTVTSADWFFKEKWKVSLIIVNALRTTSGAVLSDLGSGDANYESLKLRCAVFDRTMLRNMLGPSFALMIEIAQGLAPRMYELDVAVDATMTRKPVK